MPLGSARLQTIIWTSRPSEARRFYSEILGLELKGESHGALVYDVGGGELRVSPVPTTEPSAHTVLGFAVPDARKTLQTLLQRGIVAERFPPFRHDADGLWTAPDGTVVGWFRDPDGNLLSVVQYPAG